MVLVDTIILVAIANVNDTNHADAVGHRDEPDVHYTCRRLAAEGAGQAEARRPVTAMLRKPTMPRSEVRWRPAEPQATLTPITEAAIFLTVSGEDGARRLLTDVNGLTRSVGFRIPEAALTCVVGIGADLWGRAFGRPRPAGRHRFRELNGQRHRAPATPGDLLFHIRARRLDLCFELAQLIGGWGRVIDEVHGFRSFDERGLLGFVDGTENPAGPETSANA